MKELFNFKVQWGMQLDYKPEVDIIEFGDGYQQRRPRALNSLPLSTTATIRYHKVREREMIKSLDSFLARHGGYKSFEWIYPGKAERILILCSEWSKVDNGPYIEYSLQFKQVFN
jgi:phage minor tail protein|nr:MAG TPA: minor tail protein [Bacteriophage sp.]